jgi:hypothetical protein
MKKPIVVDTKLVAACGLYCGACRAYLNEHCPGCVNNDKATWCKIRSCTKTQGMSTCAECREHTNPMACGKFNNIFSKVIGFVFRSNRPACIEQIKTLGLEGHAQRMAELRSQTIKR